MFLSVWLRRVVGLWTHGMDGWMDGMHELFNGLMRQKLMLVKYLSGSSIVAFSSYL